MYHCFDIMHHDGEGMVAGRQGIWSYFTQSKRDSEMNEAYQLTFSFLFSLGHLSM